jgi:glycosyltransferase involved in cell wall biosynthesis
MKLAYVTEYDPLDIRQWSGTGYYIARALHQQSIEIDYLGPLQEPWSDRVVRKAKRHYYSLFHQKYLKDSEPLRLKHFAAQLQQKLSQTQANLVFSATVNPIAYLDCDQPIVFWADATFAGLLNFYPQYSNLCPETLNNWHQMESLAIQKSKLAIYSSDWAAQTAIDTYQADPAKVKVVPFGANLFNSPTLSEVKTLIESRPTQVCKLLFLGVDWIRKGGDTAFRVAQTLNQAGLKTELTIVGCTPDLPPPLPDFVKPLGFISKATPKGQQQLHRLIAESHFLILPSRAECYGIVLCEANALGVPCLATDVGGIPTIIRGDRNGKCFSQTAPIEDYCDYITQLFTHYSDYRTLALSSFDAYQSRLNWQVAGQTVKQLLKDIER